MKTLLASIAVLVVAANTSAAIEPDWTSSISAEAAQADLTRLYTGLQSAHFDLFANKTRAEYDERFAITRSAIDRPVSRFDLFIKLQKFTAYGDVAHARIDFPTSVYDSYRAAGGAAFPIYLRIVGGQAYVGEDYSGTEALSPGDEILAINDQPMADWLNRTAEFISADTPYIAHSLLEFSFPMYLWAEIGASAKFKIRYQTESGRIRTTLIPARSRTEIENLPRNEQVRFALNANVREARILDGGIGYLRPGPFYNFEDPSNIWNNEQFRTFIDGAFREFAADNANSLIIDLRDNPGGDNSFSDLMIQWIADRPFRFASEFTIKSSDEADASNQARLDASPEAANGMSGVFAREYARTARGETFTLDLPFVVPRSEYRFEGPVYVLINRHSYSNAVSVAAIFQDYGWGKIVGEKTSDMATTYGAMETFELPNSGLVVGFPKAHIVRPSGDRMPDGVTPDIAINTPIVAGAEDDVLNELISIITRGGADADH